MNALRYLPFLSRGFKRSGPPLHLTLFVTGVCNLRCRHCFHFAEVAAAKQGPSVEDVRKLADSAAGMGPLLWVSFGGGEPFLRKDLPELAAAFGRHGLRHLAIPTNGMVEESQYATTEAILASCPDTYLSVSVSIDGPPAIHDAIRDHAGAHERAVAAVGEYRRLAQQHGNLGVGVILTLTRENQDVLAEHLEELVHELRPDNVTLNLARDKALDESLLEVDMARYHELVQTKQRLMSEGSLEYFDFPLARVAVARDRMMYEHVAGVRSGAGGHLPCTAGSLSAVIFEDGEVHPCEVLGRSLGSLGAVDWDLSKLWSTQVARDIRREIRDTQCKCTWECAQADNVLFHPPSWPRLALATLRARS